MSERELHDLTIPDFCQGDGCLNNPKKIIRDPLVPWRYLFVCLDHAKEQ